MPSSNSPTVLVPRSGARFDWVATVLAAIFTGGVFLDGWAHTHGRVDDTFFTPWHAVLYAGFLAMALLLVGRAAWGVARVRASTNRSRASDTRAMCRRSARGGGLPNFATACTRTPISAAASRATRRRRGP